MKHKNLTSYQRGILAEQLALFLLRLKGYKIIARRYKVGLGEIDLIAKRGRTLAMIEVKARNTIDTALHSITPKQQQRIRNAASIFLAHNQKYQSYDVRFDAICVGNSSLPRHFKNVM